MCVFNFGNLSKGYHAWIRMPSLISRRDVWSYCSKIDELDQCTPGCNNKESTPSLYTIDTECER